MKRILFAILLMILCMSLIVSCGNKDEEGSDDPTTATTGSETTENPDETDSLPGKIVSLPYGGYNLTNAGATDAKLAIQEDGITYTTDASGNPLLTLYPVVGFKNVEAHYICFGDETSRRLVLDSPLPGKEIKTQSRKSSRSEQFVFHEQADGTYIIRTTYSQEIVLGYENGKIINQEFDAGNKNQYWTLTHVDYPETEYAEWVSAKGNIFLRLPIDILKSANTTDERMQIWADDIQKTYDAYVELTGYTPYPAIVVKGYAHQNVMAGVVDGFNTIMINVDWYVDDVIKLQKRWEDNKRDFNFCILHEMGHMFDSGRGWNFESEMEADLKAVYVLYKHQKDDKYGAYAAPAEFPANRCFDYDTIVQAYDELGADMEKEYSFYGAAQLFTELVYETGWDPLIKTFHYFQDENLLVTDLKPIERFNTFISKWDEYSEVDVISFIGGKKMVVLREKYDY